MPEHVRVHVKAQLRARADLLNQIIDGLPRHRSAFAEKEVWRSGIVALFTLAQPSADRPQLIAFQRLMCREAAFLPAHIETAGVQIEILQAQINEFRDT